METTPANTDTRLITASKFIIVMVLYYGYECTMIVVTSNVSEARKKRNETCKNNCVRLYEYIINCYCFYTTRRAWATEFLTSVYGGPARLRTDYVRYSSLDLTCGNFARVKRYRGRTRPETVQADGDRRVVRVVFRTIVENLKSSLRSVSNVFPRCVELVILHGRRAYDSRTRP